MQGLRKSGVKRPKTMTAAQRKAKQRARAVKDGLCLVCCINPKARGKTVCDGCNEAAKARVKASRE
jgi:hypothetical protein